MQSEVGSRKIKWHLPPLLIGFCALLGLIRWTVRDAWGVSAGLYYFGQPVVISVLLIVAGLVGWRTGRKKLAILSAVGGACMAIVWGSHSFRFQPGVPATASYRAVLWNVMSGRFGWKSVYETLREADADVIVLVEAWQDSTTRESHFNQYLPEHHATLEHGGLLILARESLTDVTFDKLNGGGRYLRASLKLDGSELTVLAVDVESDPTQFRKAPLEDLADVITRLGSVPLIMAGDFNTPPDSVHFDGIRSVMGNAFEMVGSGYEPTWPSILPALPLDQYWLNKRIEAHSCAGAWTLRSDHRPVILEFGM